MKLDLTSLINVANSLKLALDEFAKTQNSFVKDACIQRFEYTYELSHKLLKRQLEIMSANPDAIDQLSFQNLIREGSEKGLLLNGWEQWKIYRQQRGAISHAYSEPKAAEVFAIIPDFYAETKYLLQQLQKHNGDDQ